ncbi:MAG: YidC/Oxa1 family membrane protein insertase [Gammaproteobacteria bacterium]|jgi:YidC/Oxa1 family membrane protein insertase
MDNIRLFLVIALSLTAMMLWEAWQRDYNTVNTEQQTLLNDPVSFNETPQIDAGEQSAQPSVPSPTSLSFEPSGDSLNTISVSTDFYDIKINLLGGGIAQASLKNYPIEVDQPENHFALLDQTETRFFIHQGGIKGNTESPDHRSNFSASRTEFTLADGREELIVDLSWDSPSNLHVTKRYIFNRSSYLINIEYIVNNTSEEQWNGRIYEQLQRSKPASKRSLVYTFTGAALSTPEKRYEKFDFDDLEDAPLNTEVVAGWVGILEHYFVSALIPPQENLSHFYSLIINDKRYAVGYWGPSQTVAIGNTVNFKSSIYIGPKLQEVLHDVTPGLELTVDFGVLWFIAKPLFVTLQFIKDLTGNWGWAIILLTMLLKLGFYPLSAAGYRSMANMRKVQPKMLAIKERHGGDRTRMNQAMMELYKEEKINPLGGCLPIIVQIPVFISLYWVLLESVELRQAPFALWLQDLSSKDPMYVLPLIMGVSMWFQQKLNPAPMDPIQQKVMQILPFAFTIFFMFFPSGLVLYWVVNNVLSIAQQWSITRSIENAPNK